MSRKESAPEGERIQKVLARAGVASRRAIEEMIVRGRIRVNGKRVELGRRIDPSKDLVEVDGSRVPLSADLVYYLMNKPVGVVTTASDEAGRETVIDLLDDVDTRVYPVGRLDLDSGGALLLTNDGDLALRLTHPRFGVHKTYLAEVEGSVKDKTVRQIARGVELDGMTAPARARLVERTPGGTLIEISLAEGRNRQVRRMLEAVGHPVRHLVRTAIGPLMLGRLKPATYRRLKPDEVRELYRAAGL